MAKKPTTRTLDSDVAKELEKALDLDLSVDGDGGLDMAASMEDLEAQISAAADELAREGRGHKEEPVVVQSQNARPIQNTQPAAKPAELRPVETRNGAQPAGFTPANDDRQKDYRTLLHGLNRRASSTIYWVVAFISLAWIAGAGGLANLLFGSGIWKIRTFDQFFARPELIGLAVAAIIPVILFWAFAAMVRRAQEMRIAAQSMTEVAFRLAEPENLAQDRVMMIGQAVRREVAAMGEGIERTLARAVELETLVHSEVNQIERSYSENEARIRSLVDGLGSEREAVVSHAERVRASIASAHETLRDEIGSASDIIRDSILNASTKLSMTINNSGDTLIDRINESSMSIFDSVEGRLDSITDRLSTSGEAFASLLDTRIAKLTDTTDGLTRSLTDLLDDRTSGMVSLLGGAARTLSSEFENSLSGIERTLAERGQALISEFQTRAEALDTGTQKLNAALEARARQINETLVERAREIANTFAESKDQLSAMIDQGKTQIGADMADIVSSTSSMLEARASDFAGRMEAARHVVSRSFDSDIQRLADARVGIEEAVENHSRKLSESRDRMAAAMQADLATFAESRAGIDAAVTD
ncbi:kinesin, partial [Mesorhizobium sp. M4B.F.Ca.ET.049.02.1.2]